MKIAWISETYPPEVNGVAMTNERLVTGMRKRGHRVQVFRPRQPGEAPSANEEEVRVPSIPVIVYPGVRVGLPRKRDFLKRWRKDRPDRVHIATEGPLGHSALAAARKLEIPVSSVFHTNFHQYCKDYGAPWLEPLFLAFLRRFHNRCNLTWVPSPELLDALEQRGLQHLYLLQRGVDCELFTPAKRSESLRHNWGVQPGDAVALFVSRIASEKNLPLVLDSVRLAQQQNPRLKMVVVGDGPRLRSLQRKYPEVHFCGMRYGEDLAIHYASADWFLFGSTSETFGNVILEAMASGLEVIAYDYAAPRAYIQHGKQGWLVPFENSQQFRQTVLDKLSNPDHCQPQLGQAARLKAEQSPWSDIISTLESRLFLL